MSFLDKKISSKAFTLIEILIYTAIFGVVAAGIIGVAWNITRLHTTQIASNEIDENLRYVMNLVNSKVREATMIEQASGTTLILRMPDSAKNPTTFSLSNGTLYIQEGSANPVAITSNRVEVTSLNFEYISVAGSKGGVRINITMAYKEQPGIASREYLTTVTKVNAITFDSDILPDVTNLRNVGVESLRWKNGYFSGNVNVAGDVTASGYITGTTGLCMGTDCRTSWGQVTGVTGSGTQNYIAKWTSSGSIGNSQIFDNGTNVGIGTTSPTNVFDIVTGNAAGYGNYVQIRTSPSVAYRGGLLITNAVGTTSGYNSLKISSSYNSNISAVARIGFVANSDTETFLNNGAAIELQYDGDIIFAQGSGRVGIGTVSPPSLLSVGASSQFQVNSSGDIVKIKNLTYSWPSSHAVGFLKNDGSGNLTWDTSGAVGGTGSAGQVAFWSSTTTIAGDSGFYWDNTNKRLGLGTTAPGQRLSVVGDIGLSGGERFIGTTDAYGLSIRTNNTNRIFISADGNVGIGTTSPSRTLDVHGIAQLRGAPGGTGLFVDSGGNVGIGTTSPRVRLDVEAGAIRAQKIQWDFDDKTLAAELDADASSSGNVYILTQEGNNFMIYTRNAANTSNIDRLRIQNKADIANFSITNSNVGIGTTSPSVKLHVYESDAAKSGVLFNIATTSSSYYALNVQSAGTSRLYVRADGNVGIGTTSPSEKLMLSGGKLRVDSGSSSWGQVQLGNPAGTETSLAFLNNNGSAIDYSTPTNNNAAFIMGINPYNVGTTNWALTSKITTGTPIILATQSGNVGIGTTVPGSKLDVAGEIRGTILKDRDNTNYYIDPSSTSVLNSAYARNWYVLTDGVPTSNLGNPTLPEMALFQEQFNNKLEFYDISKFTFEYYDGSNWVDVTSSISDVQKKRFVGGDTGTSISIQNGVPQYRITIRNNGNYVYLNALYMYFSTRGHTMQVQIWKKRDDGDWVQHTFSTSTVSGWPGHLYLPFSTIPWSLSSTSGHYNDVRIVFIPTWNSSYPTNNIELYKLQLWGGYPAGKRTIYSVDEDKNVAFPANVGIGTTSPSVKLHVYESDAAKSGVLFNIATTSSSYYALNVQSAGTSRLYVRADGNVGIGTTSPEARLHIETNDNITATFKRGTNARLDIGNTPSYSRIVSSTYNGGGYADLMLETVGGGTIYLKNSGNVGIGTTNPAYKLDVSGDIRATGTIYGTFSGTINAANVSAGSFGANTGGGNYSFPADLTVSGNVGIGTTSPGAKLDVAGNIRISNGNALVSPTSGGGNNYNLIKLNGNTIEIGQWEGSYGNNLILKGGNGAVIADFSDGNNSYFSIRKVLGETPTELVRVIDSGNVGIGTTSPGYKLEVAGSFKSSSGGGNLIQDTSGNVIIEL